MAGRYFHWLIKATNWLLVIGSAVSVAVFVANLYSFAQFEAAIKADETVPVYARDLELLLVYAETGQRGFVITNDQRYLDIYRVGIDGFPARFAILAGAVNEGQRDKVIDLGKLANAKMVELADVIRTRTDEGFDAAARKVSSHLGKNLMDGFRQCESEILTMSAESAQIHAQAARTAGRWTLAGLFCCIVCFFVLMLKPKAAQP